MNKVTSADGTPIAYERSGDGPPLILVGGAFNDRGSAVPLAGRLASHFSVVRYDRRGRGDSGDTPPYEVAREVEDLKALVGDVGGEPAMYGHSSGAALALRAVAAGLPVSRLALYEVPFTPDEDAARKTREDSQAQLKALLAEGRRGDAVIEFMTRMGLPPEMAEGMRHAPMFTALEALAPTLVYDDDVTGSAIPRDVVGSVTVPTLVVYGGMSPEPAKDVAQRLTELLAEGSLAELGGQTHDVAPEVLAPVLVTFFTG